MKSIKTRNIVIGEGIPKVCVPIVGKTSKELLSEVEALKDIAIDIVEWRMDHFIDVESLEAVKQMVHELRCVLQDIVLLATFRSKKEGGEKEVSSTYYVALNKTVIDTKEVDFVDVELFSGDVYVNEIVNYAHEHGVYVIMSNHDFNKTPTKDEIIKRLCKMQEMHSDITKIAVMPQNKQDVLTLLCASNDMYEQYAKVPLITMSMAATGAISRMCGEVFGSCVTFGAAKKASAPGQMAVKDLRSVLEIIHNSL